jgi:hypothetical protein
MVDDIDIDGKADDGVDVLLWGFGFHMGPKLTVKTPIVAV